MKKDQNLNLELVKYMFGILGFGNPFIANLFGISFEKFSKSGIKINYEETGDKFFPIYSVVSANSNKSVVKILSVCLEDDEFCAVMRCDDGPVYGLKYLSDDESAIFLIAHTDKNWTKTSMQEKLMACLGLEILHDGGVGWKWEPVGDFLHSCLLDIVEM